MRRKKKITIVTYESHERMTIRSGAPSIFGWCERCASEVLMVTLKEAAARAGADSRVIFRGVESGEIHFVESDNGLLVCLESVSTLGQEI
jgi:hypothetical protein